MEDNFNISDEDIISEENMEIVEQEDDNILDTEDYSEVLELTEYNNSLIHSNNDKEFSIAQYDNIQPVEISQKHKTFAKGFVSKITKFILDFNDVELTEEHKKYIKNVGNLQVQHLEDLLTLVDMNKQMITNIVHRVNATQAEDYVIINSYNNLLNQHLKLIKELQNTYKSIPTVLKKMKTDILCNQELGQSMDDELITEDLGETHFNSSKQLNIMLQKRKLEKENSENNKENLPN